MNKINKKITARFFSIQTNEHFFDDFASIQNAVKSSDNNTRILNIRDKKHLIKISDDSSNGAFFLSVVRERNTWQARALGNGNISGIPLNQGIIGDPYYFLLVPQERIIVGFTTGLSGSLKSVAKATLEQFNKDRLSEIKLEPISKKKELAKLKDLKGFNKLHFKVNIVSLGELNEETPELLKGLSNTPFLASNSQISLTMSDFGEGGFSEEDLMEIVNFLSENDGCSALTVQGLGDEGEKVHLNFSNAYVIYHTEIQLREKFIDETIAKAILNEALNSFDRSTLKDQQSLF